MNAPLPRLLGSLLLSLLSLSACAPPADDAEDSTGASSPQEEIGPVTAYAGGAERADVLVTLQLLFDALETGDEELLRSVVDPSVVMHYAEVRDGETTHASATVDGLATRITSSDERLVERMWDPVVLVDGPLATIWTPYDFHAGETFSHCGIDVANLLRTDDGWRIVGLSWTRLQPPACERHPDGPPSA